MLSAAVSFLFVVGTCASQGLQVEASLDEAMRDAVAGRALDVHQTLTLGDAHAPLAWVAENPHAGVRARFDSDGVTIELDDATGEPLHVAMKLESWGAPSHPQSAARAIVAASGASVTLERGELIEWYHNGVDGLAQGFTVLSAPENTAENGLEVRMRVDGDLSADVQGDDRLVWRDECGRARLSYSGLRAWDHTGRDLDARLIAAGEWLSILVDDSNALYPITIDPLIATLETKLLTPLGAVVESMGTRVDIDGDTAVVVGYQNTLSHRTKAYIFVRDSEGWSRQAVVSSGGTSYNLGDLVLSGNTVIFADNAYSGTNGCYYRFQRTGTIWTFGGGGCTGGCCTSFGLGLALTSDHYAYTNDEGGSGNTKIYAWSGVHWIFHANMPPAGYVALRDDLLAISINPAPYWSAPEVRIYQRTGSAWALFATPLTLPNGRYPVALDDEHTLAVGIPNDSQAGVGAGAVMLMRREGTTWVPWQKILPPNYPTSSGFGVALAFENGTLAIGCALDDSAATNAGAVYVYRRNGGWQLEQQLLAPDAAAAHAFGTDVAIEGERLLVGAPNDDEHGPNIGSAYVFELASGAKVYCTAKVNSADCLPEIEFDGTPSASSIAPFLISARNVINNKLGLFFYGFGGRAALPFEGGVRCTPYPIRRTLTQMSGGNAGPDDCSGSYSLDFNARIQSGVDGNLVAGAQVNGQFWSRDGAASFGVGLSDAIEFVIRP